MHTLMFPLVTAMGVLGRLDPVPEDEDIKAGYVALFLWVGLLIVIGLLGRSMVRHLRTSEANRKAGVYPGDPAEPTAGSAEPTTGPTTGPTVGPTAGPTAGPTVGPTQPPGASGTSGGGSTSRT